MTDLTKLISAIDDEITYLRDDGSDAEHAIANSLSRIREALNRSEGCLTDDR